MNKVKYFFFLPASIVLLLIACNHTVTNPLQSGNWVTRSESDANARFQAVSFVVGDTSYIGTGYDGLTRYSDLWSLDATGRWHECASLPQLTGDSAPARNGAVAFAIGRTGYLTTGTDGYNKFKDTWAYNVDNNTWVQKADFANGTLPGRYGASAFAIGSYGYVTCGNDNNYLKDLWQYDPTADKWTQKSSVGSLVSTPVGVDGYSTAGFKRMLAVTFIYKNQGYIVTGLGGGGTNVTDFWKYDPPTDTWISLRQIANVSTSNYDDDYTDIARNSGVAFVQGDSAYLTVGISGGYTQKTWAYDFKTDLWSRKTSFERSGREGAVAFVLGSRAFVSMGKASSTYFDDLEEWQPNAALNTND